MSSLPGSNGVQRAKYSDVFSQFALTMTCVWLTESGIVALPNPKPGRSLDPEVAYAVENLCCNDSIGRIMSRKNDYVAVKTEGTKENKQKKPML
jgi:hypothetical protein